jgi:uncharacterized membrane protein YgdD (TMEM256/DUF423 family)
MTRATLFRIAITLAGVMGAAGVILAAVSAHKAGGTILASASSMLLFHAPAVLAAISLVERNMIQPRLGLAATLGFIVGALLFGGDLTVLQFLGHSLFPMAAPTGGTLLIISWLVLAIAAVWPRRVA